MPAGPSSPFEVSPASRGETIPPHSLHPAAQQLQQPPPPPPPFATGADAGAVTHFRPGSGPPTNNGSSIDMSGMEAHQSVFHAELSRDQDVHITSAADGQTEQQHAVAVPGVGGSGFGPTGPSPSNISHRLVHGPVMEPSPVQHGQFGILAPGLAMPEAITIETGESLVGPAGFIPIDGTTTPGWRPHGSLLSTKWVLDPPNLDEWRQKLFDADGLIILTHEQFETYFPHVDNVYSHRSTQNYKKKPFISHYWDCRLKGRPPGTKKSDDPTKKRRNRISRKLNLCDVKIKITEYFPGATLHDVDDGTYVPLNGGQALNGAHTVLAPPGERELRVAPATPNNLPAPGQKFWTIQRVNGHISVSGIPGPHQHTLAKSDEVKKNSIQRYLAKHKTDAAKNDGPRKATGRAHWTIKKHEKESDLKLYSACYCPFSQSVWIALEAKGLAYQYCEEDPYKVAASQPLLEANPRGTVPAIRQGDWACADSGVILEYLEDMDSTIPLFPSDVKLRANCRQWIGHINTRLAPAFYRLLRSPDPTLRPQYIERLQNAIKDLVLAADEEGPFFLGNTMSLVDVHFAPFAVRLSRVLQPMCGWPAPAPGLRWAKWLDALESNVHVQATTSGKAVYAETVEFLQVALDPDGQLSI
ncbi:glutathione S-transferase domain-containing protein [Colletotrichum abscissum]|uniref:Glutathione S-transferase domain-containing protein n=1 Tax=Colletotrichum abscissum TaxID=1671311 RepID=A0A9Q0B4I5_9PEZI|nr:glutathione S-transferase domain-containing protein [Colletotrichum abscissum]KAI3554750.1 glutathione S-transferase domain-containing protein [Colletotrichum abscissum]KAK1472768.1 glutathione S-transferase domain-containing protein [Colletotrichum abscissum]KAK1709009.1 glutathione S-transferase domain-containing protein [Colletotrichum lupini]